MKHIYLSTFRQKNFPRFFFWLVWWASLPTSRIRRSWPSNPHRWPPRGGITPIFTLKIQNFKELVWGWLPWNFQCFNWFQLEMTWIFTYIRSRMVLFNIVQKRADEIRAFFRILFFQLLLYSCYGCALFGFHMPYELWSIFWDRKWTELDRKWAQKGQGRTENGPETDRIDW